MNIDRRPAERAVDSGAPASPPSVRERAEDGVRWAAVLLGCSIPISVAADNILLAFLLACWIAGGTYRAKLAAVRGNPVALTALALFALYVVGMLYTIGSGADVFDTLTKALRLLLVPALMPLMRDAAWRNRGIAAFLGSMLVTLVLSYLLWLGVVPVSSWLKGTALDPVAFKAHITHNAFMAFAAYLFALAALDAKTRRGRWAAGALCAAAIVNVLVMVPGRTGHIVLLVLFAYYLYCRWRAWGLALAGIAVGVLAVLVVLSPDSMLHKRITVADDEFQQWRAGVPPDPTSSVGQRMAFLRNTVELIRERPVLGVGTGGFASAYAVVASRTGDMPTQNPHNEFLLMTAQFGFVGLAVLLGLFGTQWWLAAQLPGRFEQAAARGLVLTIVVASALSSTLVDHSEGIFFAYMSGLLFASYDRVGRRGFRTVPTTGGDVTTMSGATGASTAKRLL